MSCGSVPLGREFRSIRWLKLVVLGSLGTFLQSSLLLCFSFVGFRDLNDEAVGHFKKKCELLTDVGLAEQQFCGQSGLLIDLNLLPCHSLLLPRYHASVSAKMPCGKYALSDPFSAAAMSAKMPHWKHDPPRPVSLDAAKRGCALDLTVGALSRHQCIAREVSLEGSSRSLSQVPDPAVSPFSPHQCVMPIK